MQAQNPNDPYCALWSRGEGFHPESLSGMIERREAVRGALMRGTIHLATTPDFVVLRPQLQATLASVLGSTVYAKDSRDIDREALLDLGRSLLEERPMTRAELAPILEERWPGVPGASLAQVVTYLLPVIQVPPRGLWGQTGPAAWTTIEAWAGVELPLSTDVERTVTRYLAAFGPASVADMRIWSRLSGLRPVIEQMRGRLRVLGNENGTELFDLPDAPSSTRTHRRLPASSPNTTTSCSGMPIGPASSFRRDSTWLGGQPNGRRHVQRLVEASHVPGSDPDRTRAPPSATEFGSR